ncbi:MAG: sodium/proline symporter [Oscillospiraceae bacterium]|nr:sodium/proline symporter [Oscillospiraceae bacterium]
MNLSELIVFILYLIFMLSIGVIFFLRQKAAGEKDYFLGGRQMGAWVSGLSAGASDMSAWVLMGLPASIYLKGMGSTWIAIGLFIGYTLSWILVAPRLRAFSLVCGDSITIPQYLTNRFLSKNRALQVICAVIFLVAYTVYAASSIKACGTLFNTVLGINARTAMYVAALIIIGYTFLGGYSAVCWTDFFQGLLMLGALLIAPLVALALLPGQGGAQTHVDAGYWRLLTNWKDVVSGMGWGLGYFGMPHIIIRFMSVKSQGELKKARKIGVGWTFLILSFSVAVGVVAHLFLGDDQEGSVVFISMVRRIFSGPWLGLISGLLLSAILAGAMSTADSQLLAASSAFASDVYKPLVRQGKSSEKEMLWAGRYVVLAIALVALMIASNPKSGTIMSLVENAWGIFGAAFGPVILLSLYWRRLTFAGAAAGIVVGAAADILWLALLSSTGIYEIVPGFLAGLIAAVLVTGITLKGPGEAEELFDRCLAYRD